MAQRSNVRARQVARVLFIVLFLIVGAGIIFGVWFLWRVIAADFGGPQGDVVVVPDVVGLPEEEAVLRMQGVGLVAKVERRLHSEAQPENAVFKQEPLAQDKIKQGGKVKLWISLGPANMVVPELIGLHLDEVPAKLAQAGLTLGVVHKYYNDEVKPGVVLNQRPEPGRQFSESIPVEVDVADNANLPKLLMPALTGKRLALAEDQLMRENLHLAEVQYVADDQVAQNTVTEQSVAAATQVDLGTEVQLKVALSSALLNRRNKRVNLSIQVPPGPARQQVRIKVYDELGMHEAYNAYHSPGDRVQRAVDVEGKATVQVFLHNQDEPFRVDRLPAPESAP